MSQALHCTVNKDFSTSSSDEPAHDSDHHNEQQKPSPLQRNPHQSQENIEFDFTSNTSATTPVVSSSTSASVAVPVTSPAAAAATVVAQPQQEQPQPQKVINSPPSYSDMSIDSPLLKITLLCMNSTRVTLEIDQNFIASHGLSVKNPDSITIGQFKQVIYDEWMSSQKQAEGEDTDNTKLILQANKNDNWGRILAENVTPVPVSPLYVRIIYLGKVLVDEYTFEDYSISSSNANNVLHISVKPDIAGSKDKNSGGKHSKSRRRSTTTTHGSAGNTLNGAADSNEEHNNAHTSGRSGCCVIC